ncbi:MAG TPA: 4-carboxymuconolactone decarboxylase [Actinospica sp.]|jgi:3-oxoadipate enol-lactonase/4-carboxymuconolactone decarboxylase|nr:4-carboxymuconolactone decarboxylase [Actinospica sp.]
MPYLTYVTDGPPVSPLPPLPPLILGSSIGTTAALWDAVVPVLARDRTVIRWNLPGHGGSPADLIPTDGSATIADFAALVLNLADALDIPCFDYAGDSFGAAIGTYLAAHHPDRVNALAICCTSAHFGDPSNWQARAKKVRDEGTAAMAELGDTAPDRWFPADSLARTSPATADLIATHKAVDPRGYAACCDAIAAVDLTPVLADISAPTLVIAGRGDPATPPAHARELADGIRDSTLTELAGVGHLAPYEAPEAVAGALQTHVSGTRHAAGMAVRRAVLGDAHVDRAIAKTTPFTQPFQDLITRYAWGEIWTRPGLDRRTRSCITLTALVAHGHLEELAMHVRAARTNGLTPDEIGEVLLQTAIYCGVPAANAAFAVAQRVLAEPDQDPRETP